MSQVPMLVILGVLLVAGLLGSQAVTLYADWLWFHEVGFSGVFSTILYTKTLLGLLAGALLFLLPGPDVRRVSHA